MTRTVDESTSPAEDTDALETREEAPEAQLVTREAATAQARDLLRATKNGILGTLSKRAEGAPFGSVVPYALDETGSPLIFLAGIAEHTKNLKSDPRVSLLIHEPVEEGIDIQTKARLCAMGTAEPAHEGVLEDAWARYVSRLPAARGYRRTHDFNLWRIEPNRFRWIGGFGEIFWLRAEDFRREPGQDPLREQASGIVSHMNEDHLDATLDFYRAHLGVSPPDARMVGIDIYGMDFASPAAGRLRVDFDHPTDPSRVRSDVISALRTARQKITRGNG